jgi:hypothetical protein
MAQFISKKKIGSRFIHEQIFNHGSVYEQYIVRHEKIVCRSNVFKNIFSDHICIWEFVIHRKSMTFKSFQHLKDKNNGQ